MYRVLCGTPQGFCSGSRTPANAGLGKQSPYLQKMHTSHESAFHCHKKWLIEKEGFVEIGSRELRDPKGGVLVLKKQSRFGAKMRSGKQETGKRFQPKGRAASGVIITQ